MGGNAKEIIDKFLRKGRAHLDFLWFNRKEGEKSKYFQRKWIYINVLKTELKDFKNFWHRDRQ